MRCLAMFIAAVCLLFQNPVSVQPPLLTFMFPIDLLNGEIFVRLCVWVTNPHVEKGRALPIPKATSMNIQSGIRCLVHTPRQHFSGYPLENRFHLYIVANRVYHVCLKITQLIMPLDDESSSSTHHSMIPRECIATNASEGRVRYVPVIAEMNGIPKLSCLK